MCGIAERPSKLGWSSRLTSVARMRQMTFGAALCARGVAAELNPPRPRANLEASKINYSRLDYEAPDAGYLGKGPGRKGRDLSGSIRKLGERRYQARWVDPDGRECSKIFSRRTDAEDKIKEVEHSKLDGSYIDHKNPITVAQYAKQWSATRPHRSTTATRVKSMIDNHIAGTRLGGRRLYAVSTSEVQA